MELKLTVIILFISLLISCDSLKGPEGDQGPEGPRGEQGPTGPPGNANVLTITGEWSENNISCANDECTVAYVQFSVDELTAIRINSAAVIAYVKGTLFSTSSGWTALPFTNQYYEFTYAYDTELFELIFVSHDGLSIFTNDVPVGQVKIVIIPEGVQAKVNPYSLNNRIKTPGINHPVTNQLLPTYKAE